MFHINAQRPLDQPHLALSVAKWLSIWLWELRQREWTKYPTLWGVRGLESSPVEKETAVVMTLWGPRSVESAWELRSGSTGWGHWQFYSLIAAVHFVKWIGCQLTQWVGFRHYCAVNVPNCSDTLAKHHDIPSEMRGMWAENDCQLIMPDVIFSALITV